MIAYLPVLLMAATPLVLGLVALIRGRREDIPVIMRALTRGRRKLQATPSGSGSAPSRCRIGRSVRHRPPTPATLRLSGEVVDSGPR
jgi:hypothetical protein